MGLDGFELDYVAGLGFREREQSGCFVLRSCCRRRPSCSASASLGEFKLQVWVKESRVLGSGGFRLQVQG